MRCCVGSASREGAVAFRPTRHALLRYQEHYPTHTVGDLTLAVGTGDRISAEMAACFIGRPVTAGMRYSRYVLHPRRTGLFVLVHQQGRTFEVVTYLRFGAAQQRIAGAPGDTRQPVVREAPRQPMRRLVRPPPGGGFPPKVPTPPRSQ